MSEFNEKDHPRAPKGSSNGGQFVSKINFGQTTKQEQAQYYHEIQKVERGEYTPEVFIFNKRVRGVAVQGSNRTLLFIDNNRKFRAIKSSGVYVFADFDEMIDTMDFVQYTIYGEEKC